MESKNTKPNVVPSSSPENQALLDKITSSDSNSDQYPTGLFNTQASGDKGAKYPQKPVEEFIEGKTNSGIILGNNSPNGVASGYGGKGHTQCSEIKLFCGLGTSDGRAYNDSGERLYCDFQAKEEPGPENTETSSYIVISEKADPDSFMGLSSTPGCFNAEARSSVVAKADVIRFVGREGIRLVTCTSEKNSKDALISSVAGIDLCAGNIVSEMQPMVKGANLVECIQELASRINDLKGVFDKFVEYQMDFNNSVMTHDHTIPLDPVAQALGLPAPGLKTSKNPSLLIKGMQTNIKCLSKTKFSNLADTFNMSAFHTKYLMPGKETYICSKYNNVN